MIESRAKFGSTQQMQKEIIYDQIRELMIIADDIPKNAIKQHDDAIRSLCRLAKQYESI